MRPYVVMILLLSPLALAQGRLDDPGGFGIQGEAQDATPARPDQCTPAIEGQLACMAGRACVCRFERGGQLTGRPDRFAWDCGPLRPDCPLPPSRQPQQPSSLFYAPNAPYSDGGSLSPYPRQQRPPRY